MRFPAFAYLCQLLFANVRKSAWILCLCLLGISCLEQPDCYNLTNNTVRIAFRKIADGSLDSIVLVQTGIQGLDSAFVSSSDPTKRNVVTNLAFSIDYKTDQTLFYVTDLEKTRALQLAYSVKPQFVSEECGPRFVVSDLDVIGTTADSVRITSETPGYSTGGGTNINVYRCPRTNIVKLALRQLILPDTIRKDTIAIIQTQLDHQLPVLDVVTGNLSFIKLPLNLQANATQVTFELAAESKSILFTYELVEKTVYKVCGPQIFIRNLQATSTDFEVKLEETTKYVADSIYDPPRINFELRQ